MSWPDPGTPTPHDPERDAPEDRPGERAEDRAEDRTEDHPGERPEAGVDPRRRPPRDTDGGQRLPEDADDVPGPPDAAPADLGVHDDAAPEAVPTYARLRSESEDDLGRWESPVAAGDEDPTPAGGDDRDAAGDAHVGADPDVSSDVGDATAEGVRTGSGTPAGRTGATPQHDVSGPAPDGRSSGPESPAISRHERSWDAGSAPPEVPGAGAPAGAPVQDPADPFPVERPVPGSDPFHGEHATAGPAPEVPVATPRGPSAAVIEDALAGLDEGVHHATVICVANQKGGVGKTTTTVSLGAALAMLGAQVLVVDLDPQGNATTGLGLRAQEGAPSTYRVIVEQMDVEDAAEPTAVRGLHVLPSSLDLAGAEIELVPAFSRENRLKQALDAVRDLYDVILIDCPPSLGLLTINALVAADQVLVPIQCEYYALEGLGQLMRTVKLVADSLNRGLGVGGVVLTMFDGRTNLSQQVVDEVQNYFGDIAYQTIVPRTVRLSEAPSYGQPIGVFDAASRGARAYQRLAREVARRLDLELEEEDVSPLDRLLGSSAPAPPEEAAPLPTDLGPGDVPVAPDSDIDLGPAAAETDPAPERHAEPGPPGDHASGDDPASGDHAPGHGEHHEPQGQHDRGQHDHAQHHHEHHGDDAPAHGTEGQP